MVQGTLATIGTAVAMFVATDIDDAVVVLVLNIASRSGGAPKRWEIWAGQFVGIGLLVLVSFLGALGLSTIPVEWAGLLGLIPLVRGVHRLAGLIRDRRIDRIDDLPNKRVIPMSPKARRERHRIIAENEFDPRIKPEWSNVRPKREMMAVIGLILTVGVFVVFFMR